MKKFFVGLILFAATSADAQTTGRIVEGNVFPGIGVERNFVINPKANKNAVQGITATGHTVTRSTSTPLMDGADFQITASGAGSTYWSLQTLDDGMVGQNCEFSGIYTGGGASWTATVRVGSDVVTSLPLGAITNSRRFSLNYPCSGVTSVGFTTTGSGPQIDVDDLYFGLARNIGSVAQAVALAKAFRTTSVQTISSASPTKIQLNAESLDVNGQFDSTTNYRFTAVGPTRQYLVNFAAAYQRRSAERYFTMVYKNGTAICTSVWQLGSASATEGTTGSCLVELAAGDFLELFADSEADTDYDVFNNEASTFMHISSIPSASEIAYRPDQVSWRVDANISGANPSLGTSTVPTYTGITNGSLTLTNNTGNNVLTAQIPCSGTNPPTGTTCSAGSESVGVSFNLPVAGDVLACASFTHRVVLPATPSSVLVATFQLVETPNNAQTIIQQGKTKIESTAELAALSSFQFPFRVCGNFTFTSNGQKTVRLMYTQLTSGTPTASEISADFSAVGERDIHWEVYPIHQVGSPLILAGNRAPTVQRFTSGSGTYTTPTGVRYLRVRAVGGGAGGTGSSTSAANAGNGTAGGNTTFGTSLITANGGAVGSGPGAGSAGGAGGTVTVNSPAVLVTQVTGGTGSDSGSFSGLTTSGLGGISFFGGAGKSVTPTIAGANATANTGSGGSGGGSNASLNVASGSGGGAGGYVEAFIFNPASSYSYAVGAGGTGGAAGTSGYAGGNGAAGQIIVEEFYW